MAAASSRFASFSEQDLENLVAEVIPEKTKKQRNMKWRFFTIRKESKQVWNDFILHLQFKTSEM